MKGISKKLDAMILENIRNIESIEPIYEDFEDKETHKKEPLCRSLVKYIESLAIELKTSEKVIKNSVLKSDKWTKSCYDLLSKIITEDLQKNMTIEQRMALGTSLSSKTIQKIIATNYKVTYPMDPRTLNTLNKVVLFLGHKDWDHFISKVDDINTNAIHNLSPKEELKLIVEEAVYREHYVYCKLPEIQEEYLAFSHLKNSPSYNMIMDVLVDKAGKKQIISNRYNPSTCEILDIEIKKKEKDYAQVYTKEYWLLCWWDTVKKRYVKRYKVISDHFYILNKVKGKWMIKTNASTSDPMELG